MNKEDHMETLQKMRWNANVAHDRVTYDALTASIEALQREPLLLQELDRARAAIRELQERNDIDDAAVQRAEHAEDVATDISRERDSLRTVLKRVRKLPGQWRRMAASDAGPETDAFPDCADDLEQALEGEE